MSAMGEYRSYRRAIRHAERRVNDMELELLDLEAHGLHRLVPSVRRRLEMARAELQSLEESAAESWSDAREDWG